MPQGRCDFKERGKEKNGLNTVTIIGGGLAGCEAAWQAARRGTSPSTR